MSASMYIVVEGEDPGFDIFVNGHALARNEDALEKLSLRLGVKPLLEFFSADENSMALLLEEGAGDPEWARTLPPPQWFTPEDGLITICTLHDFLTRSTDGDGRGHSGDCCRTGRVRARAAQDGGAELALAAGG